MVRSYETAGQRDYQESKSGASKEGRRGGWEVGRLGGRTWWLSRLEDVLRVPLQHDDGQDAEGNEDDLPDGVLVEVAAMKIRNEIRHRDVEKISRGKGDDEGHDGRDF